MAIDEFMPSAVYRISDCPLDVGERDDANGTSLIVEDGCAADAGERRLLEQVRDVVLPADQQAGVTVGEIVDEPCATRPPFELIDSEHADGSAVRERPVNTSGELTSYLFQGEHPASGQATARGSIYPGDVHLPSPDDVQVQIHHLRLNRDGALVEDEVPTLAIRLPAGIDDLVVQAQGGAP